MSLLETAEKAETARRMAQALAYLMKVSIAAGLPRVTAKLAVAQAELLASAGQASIDRAETARPDGAPKSPASHQGSSSRH
ncbi:hypothetical protein [Chenggangzhangella methanolivorans]|uniref:Uncharacterized protein n=1 Tax=Chenggangzhangella methanolivorans TaxID=1437009 RepID=A0A9E6UIS3_9HYPH|nr:hypothetical protein [Chenggangzhangella methanolivorans]QZO01188.1 hypothetical protein K6K41_06505 [Chenggangzhangella methanolivorans]